MAAAPAALEGSPSRTPGAVLGTSATSGDSVASAARILLRLRERVVKIKSPEAESGNAGEREADTLFGIIAEIGALLRGEQSDATLQAVDDGTTPKARVSLFFCALRVSYLPTALIQCEPTACVYVCMYVCMYVCKYIYIHTYIHACIY
jgi:hypothetical protein